MQREWGRETGLRQNKDSHGTERVKMMFTRILGFSFSSRFFPFPALFVFISLFFHLPFLCFLFPFLLSIVYCQWDHVRSERCHSHSRKRVCECARLWFSSAEKLLSWSNHSLHLLSSSVTHAGTVRDQSKERNRNWEEGEEEEGKEERDEERGKERNWERKQAGNKNQKKAIRPGQISRYISLFLCHTCWNDV